MFSFPLHLTYKKNVRGVFFKLPFWSYDVAVAYVVGVAENNDVKRPSSSSDEQNTFRRFQVTGNKMQRLLIYLFLQTLYMFQAVPPPIIRST